MSRPLDVVAALTRVSVDLPASDDLGAMLHALVEAARDATPEVDHVGLVVPGGTGGPQLLAATDDTARGLDLARIELGDGPQLVRRTEELGVHAQLGVPFRVDDSTVGALTLYSDSADGLSDESEAVAGLVAAHAAMAVQHARRVDNLTAALTSRTVIGLALGMVMQRLDLEEDAAFAYLTRISATTETKLRDVAADLVDQHQRRVRGESS